MTAPPDITLIFLLFCVLVHNLLRFWKNIEYLELNLQPKTLPCLFAIIDTLAAVPLYNNSTRRVIHSNQLLSSKYPSGSIVY